MKWYTYKMVCHKTVQLQNGTLQTLQSQSTGLYQPVDWLGVKPNLTQPWIWSVTINRSPPTNRLVGLVEFCLLYLTMFMVRLG